MRFARLVGVVAVCVVSIVILYSNGQAQDMVEWVRHFDGGSGMADSAAAIGIDDAGNVYVAGTSYDETTGADYIIIQYSPNGDTNWTRRYNGPDSGDDVVRGMAVSPDGKAFVTGYSWSDSTEDDILTIAYGPAGDSLWAVRREPSAHYDRPTDILYDPEGYVYVAGNTSNYTILKYDTAGALEWEYVYDSYFGPASYMPKITLDETGTVYMCGSDGFPNDTWGLVWKIDSDGNVVWDNYSAVMPEFASVAATVDNGAYVTGITYFGYPVTTGWSTEGSLVWWSTFGDRGPRWDIGIKVLVDSDSDVISLAQHGDEAPFDFGILKDSPEGAIRWFESYDGPGHGDDVPRDFVLGDDDRIYAVGRSYDSTTGADWLMLTYSPAGELIDEFRYDGPGDDVGAGELDCGVRIIDAPNGRVYVAGYTYDDDTGYDITLIKLDVSCYCPHQGDMNADGVLDLVDLNRHIESIFFNGPDARDPYCPLYRADINGDGMLDTVDLNRLIDILFFNGSPPVDPCN